ncbi:MAG: cation:proton antiporter [Planctomycetota bacterium]
MNIPVSLAAGALTVSEITVLLVALGVLLGTARLFGEIAKRFGQPTVLGEILAGVVLGATLLGNPMFFGEDGWNVRVYEFLFPQYLTEPDTGEKVQVVELDNQGQPILEEVEDPETGEVTQVEKQRTIAHPVRFGLETFLTLAVAFLLLTAGLEVDLSVVVRQGKAAALVSVMGMVVPLVLGFALAMILPRQLGFDPDYGGSSLPFALFLGIAMSITALPVIAKILLDLNMFRSDMGMLIMSSAMVNDLLGWICFALVLAMVIPPEQATLDLPVVIGATLVFVAFVLTAGRWLANKAVLWVQAHASWPGGILGFVLVMALLCGAITEWIGIHAIFGAFLAGVAIGDSKHLRQRTREVIEQFITNVFAPVFFAGIALRVNFIDSFDWFAVVVVLVVAMIGKIFGCYYGAKWAGLDNKESWAIGFGMSARGAMEIILAQIALDFGLITKELFVAIVVMAIATSVLAGPMMQRALGRKQKRGLLDLMHPKAGFVGKLESSNREGAIRELTAAAADALERPADELFSLVWAREQIMSTGLEQGLAVPHARVSGLDRAFIFVGISPPGIDFDAKDDQLAEVVCLILSPVEDGAAQVEALTAVAGGFTDEEARRRVVEATTATEFRAALATVTSEEAH